MPRNPGKEKANTEKHIMNIGETGQIEEDGYNMGIISKVFSSSYKGGKKLGKSIYHGAKNKTKNIGKNKHKHNKME
jgi:hypothetical protein